jgi:hypothetical protein
MSTAQAIANSLNSPNVFDSNGEAANVVDVLNHVANAGRKIARAITADACAGSDEYGGRIESLTESVMGVTSGLHDIAAALHRIADAMDHSNA